MLQPHSYRPPDDGLPPQEVRVITLRAEPWPDDARRVRVHLDVTPFQERPNVDVTISDASGDEVSSINIIETIDARMTFTMHIRKENAQEPLTLTASLLYPELGLGQVDQKQITFIADQTGE